MVLVLIGLGCKFGWCETAKARVWAVNVAIDPPILNHVAGMTQRPESSALPNLAQVLAFTLTETRTRDYNDES